MKDNMFTAPALLDTPAAATTEDDGTPSDQCELSRSLSQANTHFSPTPTLSKSNSTASGHFSIRSHVSVRAIGTIPYGELRVHHGRSDSETTERDAINSITEEADMRQPPACLSKGDIFRLLDFPADFIVGHDTVTMTTSESLQGFRDIPPSVHFLWVQKPVPSPRCGYWYITQQPGVVRIKQWDKFNEVLGDAASQYEVREQEANIESTYALLKPYHLAAPPSPSTDAKEVSSSTVVWCELTNAISAPFLDRVTTKRSVGEWLIDTMDCAKGDSRLPGAQTTTSEAYKTIVGSELQFLFSQDLQDLRILDQDTTTNPDTTDRVLALLNSASQQPPAREQDIVAELQFTFITGIHLGNTACLEQWWRLVLKVLLRAFRLAVDRPPLCRWLLRTLHAQLVYTDDKVESLVQGGSAGLSSSGNILFQAVPRGKSLLHDGLAEYKRQLNSLLLDLGHGITRDQESVGHTFEDLEAWLWKHGWDLRSRAGKKLAALDDDDEEDDDDLPVVVDLDENGREVGLVSFHHD